MRRPLLVTLALASAVTLAGCAGGDPAPDPSATPDATPAVDVCSTPGGGGVDAVTVTGDFGVAPTVDFTSPLTVDETQRAVVIAGDGEKTKAGDSLQVAYTLVDAANGTTLDSYGYASNDVIWAADAEKLLAGFAKSIGCATVGDRIVSVIPAAEAFGDQGYSELGIAPGDSLVLVVDIEAIQPTRAWGEDQDPVDGFPTVTLDDTGAPTVVIPDADAPTELQVEVLKKGDGAVVGATDTIALQYQGVTWDDGKVFDQSWPTPTSFPLANLVPGFTQAVTGQTVGSQIVAVIPGDLAYPAGSDSQLAGKTLVFVIDILGTTAG